MESFMNTRKFKPHYTDNQWIQDTNILTNYNKIVYQGSKLISLYIYIAHIYDLVNSDSAMIRDTIGFET